MTDIVISVSDGGGVYSCQMEDSAKQLKIEEYEPIHEDLANLLDSLEQLDEFSTTPESDCYPSTISSSSSLGQEEPHDLANLSPVVEDNAADDDCLGWTDGGYIPFSTSDQLGIQAPPPHQYSHEPLNFDFLTVPPNSGDEWQMKPEQAFHQIPPPPPLTSLDPERSLLQTPVTFIPPEPPVDHQDCSSAAADDFCSQDCAASSTPKPPIIINLPSYSEFRTERGRPRDTERYRQLVLRNQRDRVRPGRLRDSSPSGFGIYAGSVVIKRPAKKRPYQRVKWFPEWCHWSSGHLLTVTKNEGAKYFKKRLTKHDVKCLVDVLGYVLSSTVNEASIDEDVPEDIILPVLDGVLAPGVAAPQEPVYCATKEEVYALELQHGFCRDYAFKDSKDYRELHQIHYRKKKALPQDDSYDYWQSESADSFEDCWMKASC